MKIMFASDIHGDIECAKKMLETYFSEKADRLCLLGDLLYHGPRNDLPKNYDPKSVIALLNENREHLLCVRGNCDTEVDQMVLDFPILADYAFLCTDGITMLLTHGHHYNTKTPPPMKKGDLLIHGHTHVLCIESFGDENLYINPGSVTLPKENNVRSYMIYENRTFSIKSLYGGEIIKEIKV